MAEEKQVALFIGRFQPFHKGHLLALQWIARRAGKIIIVVGSAQSKNEARNPLSARERIMAMKEELRSDGLLGKCELIPVTDLPSDRLWVGHIDAHVPGYDVVYSNNALVRKLMKRAGKEVKNVPFFKRESYNATKIRSRMREGKGWAAAVPRKVKGILVKLHAEERIMKMG